MINHSANRLALTDFIFDIPSLDCREMLERRSSRGPCVNRRPTSTPGEAAVTRCTQTIFEKKEGVTFGRRSNPPQNRQFRFCFNDLELNRSGVQVGPRFTIGPTLLRSSQ